MSTVPQRYRQTDRRTTYDSNTALCTVMRASRVKTLAQCWQLNMTIYLRPILLKWVIGWPLTSDIYGSVGGCGRVKVCFVVSFYWFYACCYFHRQGMSRLYHNSPLSALPVDNVVWKTAWCPVRYQTGPGVIVEGCVRDRSRHVVVDVDGNRTRYAALYVSVRRAHRRRFDGSGVEVEPNFSETEKVP